MNQKKGLIISIYSEDREEHQHELETSLSKDFENFDFLKLDSADTIYESPQVIAEGYDYAREHGYEFVGRIDDDDLVVPGAYTLLMKLLHAKPKAHGFSGVQKQFKGSPRPFELDQNSSISFNPYYHYFHGITLYRTTALYPTVDQWRDMLVRDQHRLLAKMMMQSGKTLGFINTPISYLRLRDSEGNY